MAQKQKSGLGLATIFVVLLVAAAGLAVMKGMNQPRTLPNVKPKDELVTFVVTFEPTTREKMVTVVLVAGPQPIPSDPVFKSPWVKEKMLPPGVQVQLVAEQWVDGTLTCKIRKGLKVIAPEQKRENKGGVVCTATT